MVSEQYLALEDVIARRYKEIQAFLNRIAKEDRDKRKWYKRIQRMKNGR